MAKFGSFAFSWLSGAAAYIKSFHPDWSPSAIKSALMTTALPMNSTSAFIAKEYECGVEFLNPVQAVSPGLVYEVFKEDYIQLLCSIEGIDTPILRLISGDNTTCPPTNSTDLNYPSMAIHLLPMEPFAVKFTRTVRNVGVANSTYKVSVFPDSHLNISVVPQVLSFDSLNQKKSFTVTVAGGKIRDETMLSSSLVWSAGNHTVRSPIVVYVISTDYY
nr:subtilisin-like protease SBT4.3 [Ziziphus jujuba var. spinosa]